MNFLEAQWTTGGRAVRVITDAIFNGHGLFVGDLLLKLRKMQERCR